MRPVHLIHRHLEFLEFEICIALRERTQQNFVGDIVLPGKAVGRNRIQARKIALVALMLAQYGGRRVIIEAIVIAIIPDCGCTLRMRQ